MKKRTKRLLATLLASVMILQQGSTVGVLATEETDNLPAETIVTEAPVPETQATEVQTPAPETQASETKAPETAAPETKAPETKAPETQAPETKAPETQALETKAPETQAPETKAPETQAAELATEAKTPAPETADTAENVTETSTGNGTQASGTEETAGTQSETPDAPAVDAGTDVTVETVTETAAGTEAETEIPETDFTYEDARVKITATAQPEAKLPQDAEIHADYMQPGTPEYQAAAAALEAAYAGKDVVLDYVFYDIYFTAESAGEGHIEPEAGTVTVSMQFKQPELKPEADAEVQTYDVVHVENGKAQEVQSTVQTTEDGSVASVGFTSGDFSPYAVVMSVEEQDEIATIGTMVINAGDSSLNENCSELTVDVHSVMGQSGPYDSNTSFEVSLTYTLDDDKKNRLVTAAGDSDTVTLEYVLPDDISVLPSQIPNGDIKNSSGEKIGTYEIIGNKVYFRIPKEFLSNNSNVNGTFSCSFNIDESKIGDDDKVHLKFPGKVDNVDIEFKKPDVSLNKEKGAAGVYLAEDGNWYIEYKVTVSASGRDCNGVVVMDTPGSNLEIDFDSVKVNGVSENVTKNGTNSFTLPEMNIPVNQSVTVTYNAKIKDPTLADVNGKITGVDNKVQWKWKNGDGWDPNHEKTFEPEISKDSTSTKSGQVEKQKIKWTVELNKGDIRADVGNRKYTDTLTSENQKYKEDTFKIEKDGQDVTGLYKENGYLKFADDGKSFELTLPSDAGKSYFKITYETETKTPLAPGQSVEVTNRGNFADMDIGGQTLTVENNEAVAKEPEGEFDSENFSQGWKVTITAPQPNGWPEGFDFYDLISQANNMGWTDKYYGFIFDEESVQISGTTEYDTPVFSKSEKMPQDIVGNDKMHIHFKGNYPAGTVITIAYKTKADEKRAEELKNDINASNQNLYNTGWVDSYYATGTKNYSVVPKQSSILKRNNGYYYDGTRGAYIVSWEIRANVLTFYDGKGISDLKGQTIKIIENLPDGLTYVEGSAKCQMYAEIDEEGKKEWGAWNNPEKPITPSQNGQTLTFEVQPPHGPDVIIIKFETIVSELNKKYINSASWGNGTESFGDAKADVTVEYKPLEKKGEVLSVPVPPTTEAKTAIGYTIDVNKEAKQYYQDEEKSLVLFDTIPDNVSLVKGSIKIQDADGNAIENSGYSYDPDIRRLKLVIPDGVYAIVKYQVTPILDGKTPNNENLFDVQVSNEVVLEGNANIKSGNSTWYRVAKSVATINGNPTSLNLQKIDAQDTGKNLKGATFELFAVDFGADGTPTEKFIDFKVTPENGTVEFTGILFNRIYYYQETEAPVGYALDDTKHYFVYHTAGTQDDAYNLVTKYFKEKYPKDVLHESTGGA